MMEMKARNYMILTTSHQMMMEILSFNQMMMNLIRKVNQRILRMIKI
jgi:hypothetical protein